MRTPSYPSDVTDEQWRLIERYIPVHSGERRRTTGLRAVVDAVFDDIPPDVASRRNPATDSQVRKAMHCSDEDRVSSLPLEEIASAVEILLWLSLPAKQ